MSGPVPARVSAGRPLDVNGIGNGAGAHPPGEPVTRRGAPVVIDARAAARREIGGVERVATEMATRLPAMRPDRYAVARPPSAFAHRAGHLWEQALLPATVPRAKVIYCPANLAPGRFPAQRRGDPRPGRAAPSRVVLAALRLLPAPHPAAAGAPRPARDRPVGVLAARDRRRPRPRPRAHRGRAQRRGRALLAGRGRGGRAPRLRARQALRARGRHQDRPQERVGPGRRRAQAARAGHRAGLGRVGARLHACRTRAADAGARVRGGAAPARPLRRRARAGDALPVRGLRPAGARGDGQRRPGRRRRPDRAAGDLRRRRHPRRSHQRDRAG